MADLKGWKPDLDMTDLERLEQNVGPDLDPNCLTL